MHSRLRKAVSQGNAPRSNQEKSLPHAPTACSPAEVDPTGHPNPRTRQKDRTSYSRARKFLSYYKPHLPLLAAALACALLVSVTALCLPLCANYVTKRLVHLPDAPDALNQIYLMGGAMLALLAVECLPPRWQTPSKKI